MDGGAYCTLTPVVLSRGTLHAGGPYRCPNVRITGRAMATNTPPNGAFRGFGAPQTEFAAEMQVNRIAEALGDVAARAAPALGLPRGRHHADRPGPARERGRRGGARGAPPRQPSFERVRPQRRRGERARAAQVAAPRLRARGIGLALAWHGAGFTGSGEVQLASVASVELTDDASDPDPDRVDRDGPGHQDDLPAAGGGAAGRRRRRRSRWRRRTPRSCPTPARPSPRAPRWSSAGC